MTTPQFSRLCTIIFNEYDIHMNDNVVNINGETVDPNRKLSYVFDECILIDDNDGKESKQTVYIVSGLSSLDVSIPHIVAASIPEHITGMGRIKRVRCDFIYKDKEYKGGQATITITNSRAMVEFKKKIEDRNVYIGGSNIGGAIITGDNVTYTVYNK